MPKELFTKNYLEREGRPVGSSCKVFYEFLEPYNFIYRERGVKRPLMSLLVSRTFITPCKFIISGQGIESTPSLRNSKDVFCE